MIIKSFEVERKISKLIENNLFLMYGENNGLKKDIRSIVKHFLEKKNNELEVISIYENDILANEESFYNSIYSGSLFSNKKIITINDGTDKIAKIIEDITDKKIENVFILIFSGILDRKSKLRSLFEKHPGVICVPCYLDNERDLENIARNELKKNNINLTREALNLLVEKSNQDRENIKNEIDKIKSYALNKKNLELDEVKSIINFAGEYKSDHLVNECLNGNIKEFKKILSEIYSNTINQIFLLRILSNKIQKLLKIKEQEKNYKSIDRLIDEAKPPIFWKDKPMMKKQISLWKLSDLKKIFFEINDIEILCKKKPNISKIVSFNFFSEICKKASNYS